MQLPQIRLQQTYAQIGLKITQPTQEIQQPPADLSIKQIPAAMTIDRKPARLDINQDQAWNELNLKSTPVFSADMAEFSKQEGFEAIAEIAQEGDQFAAIENKTDAIVSIAQEKGCPPPQDFNIAFIPSYGSVKINFVSTELHIEWKQGGAEIEAEQHKPIHQYTPGKTEVYLSQKQQLKIDFVGINVNNQT
ncbi:DUF6470 family protein [Bacillus xiapuensis]|uniref:DUF6470 family protein n=1 Tax=Bacillus xiapuensis TaxID=2014075 RepID=A0ABU6NDQ1_9BACI|nr:DUF6470 family protein [Bacillus xiapuensis]